MSGLPELDNVLHGLNDGDNIVWRLDTMEEYISFAAAFARQSVKKGKKTIYFRYGNHPPIFENEPGTEIHILTIDAGFESFANKAHEVILAAGKRSTFIFDLLPLSRMPVTRTG